MKEQFESTYLYHETVQLEVNKDRVGVHGVHFHPEFGFLFIQLDLSSLNIDPQHASFIDLDVTLPLNLEIKFNLQ